MKWLILVGVVVVLGCAACGASAPRPRVRSAELTAALVPDVKAAAVARKRAAAREAQVLLRWFVPPHGAVRMRRPPDYGCLGENLVWERVDRCVYWRLSGSFSSASSYMRAFRLAGFDGRKSGWSDWSIEWTYGDRHLHFLTVVIFRRPSGITMAADATILWNYPRGFAETVLRATREIDIRSLPNPNQDVVKAPNVSLRVTDAAKVERVIRWFDSLPVVPPDLGGGFSCTLDLGLRLAFVFRTAAGSPLARATVPMGQDDHCFPISFSIAGNEQPSLMDNWLSRDPSFVERVEKLLDVRLTPR
jgi:hypothetical protein